MPTYFLRAVFGTRVNSILEFYEDSAQFSTPDVCVEDARRHILEIAASRRVPPADSESVLDKLASKFLYVVDRSFYDEFEEPARARISARDISDWPVVATALLLNSPIWTEDKDFLGSGVATWTTRTIELYLRDA